MPAFLSTLLKIVGGAFASIAAKIVTIHYLEDLIILGVKWLVSSAKSPVTKEMGRLALLHLGVRDSRLEKIESCTEKLPGEVN